MAGLRLTLPVAYPPLGLPPRKPVEVHSLRTALWLLRHWGAEPADCSTAVELSVAMRLQSVIPRGELTAPGEG